MIKVLVLCTGNSCRSQMAEGFLRHYAGEMKKDASIFSAGIEAHGLNPNAVKIMAEAGIDISGHQSETMDKYQDEVIDIVITVCDNAKESCPVLPGVKTIHHSFPDPAGATGTEEEVMGAFRSTRDQIDSFCQKFIEELA